jgi:hypothetical protein
LRTRFVRAGQLRRSASRICHCGATSELAGEVVTLDVMHAMRYY